MAQYQQTDKPISTLVHGAFDYLLGLLLIFAPNILGFANESGAAVMVPRWLGALIILQALCTAYELGAFKIISMRVHLVNDYVAGLFLAFSPWLLGFSNLSVNAWLPHVVFGVAIVTVSFFTQLYPSVATTRHSQA